MRRILFLIAAALTVSLAHAQEVGNVGTSAQLSIIPRIDLNPYIGFNSDAGTDFSLSNSSLYTLFEGSLGEHFSYSIMNHWLSEEPASLYQDTFFHSDVVNWCDWANLTYSLGDFFVTLGKSPMALGLWEQDAYDYESHFDLNSTMWNEMQVYQWGVDVGATILDQYTAMLQFSSSPFTERPFESGVFSSGLMLRKDEGDFNFLASLNLVGVQGLSGDWQNGYELDRSTRFIKMPCLGVKYAFGDFVAGLDYSFRSEERFYVNEMNVAGTLEFTPGDKLSFLLKGGYERCYPISDRNSLSGNRKIINPVYSLDKRFFGGLAAHYFPLRDNDALRLHAVVAYDNGFSGLSINVGALYNIAIRIY